MGGHVGWRGSEYETAIAKWLVWLAARARAGML
jgi:hypothetical protein